LVNGSRGRETPGDRRNQRKPFRNHPTVPIDEYSFAPPDTAHPASAVEVFAFFESAENLAHITPPSLGFRILTPAPITMKVGTVIDYTIRWLGIPVRWRTLITTYQPPDLFVDEQIRGPYSLWHHTHRFEDVPEGTLMNDEVHYCLPFGPIGDLTHGLVVKRRLGYIFDYRAMVIGKLLRDGERALLSNRYIQTE
jgi:ligand-binding SRPBCC domain-containing protein